MMIRSNLTRGRYFGGRNQPEPSRKGITPICVYEILNLKGMMPLKLRKGCCLTASAIST